MKSIARGFLLVGAATAPLIAPASGPAYAQTAARNYSIPAQDLGDALRQFGAQSGRDIVFDPALTAGKKSKPVAGAIDADRALQIMLEGSGLSYTTTSTGFAVRSAVGNVAADANSASSQGEDVAPNNETAEPIVVTGTNIRGIAPDSAPVTSYTKKDIEKTGAATLEEFARKMPQNVASVDTTAYGIKPTSSGINANGANNYGGAGLNLHGLGPTATLTLIDGHRIVAAGSNGDFTDISMVPLAAVDRIEVLSDGASAIYGADAVAGVANLILKSNFDGAETSLRYGGATRGGGGEFVGSQLLGGSWGGGSGLLVYEHNFQHGLKSTQRDFIPDFGIPINVLPEQRRNSVFGSIKQAIASGVSLSADAFYSKRKFATDLTPGFNIATDIDGSTELWGGGLTIDADLFPGWSAQGNVGYSRNNSASVTRIPAFGLTLDTSTTLKLLDADLRASGRAFQTGGGAALLALGVAYRNEKISDSAAKAAAFNSDGRLSRNVTSLYGELFIPVISKTNQKFWAKRFDLSIAGRYDHYDDFGSTFNPKVGVLWEPLRDFRLRGTFGTSFRAPALTQLIFAPTWYTFNVPDPSSPIGTTDLLISQANGNPDLKPETARSFSAGFDYFNDMLGGNKLSLSYFHTKFKNRITRPPVNSPVLALLQEQALSPFITRSPSLSLVQAAFAGPGFFGDFAGQGPAGVEAIFDFDPQNIAISLQSGLELSFRQDFLTERTGDFRIAVTVQYLIENKFQAASSTPEVELIDDVGEPLHLKLRGGLDWVFHKFQAALGVNFQNSYRNHLFDPATHIDSWTTVDLALFYGDNTRPSKGSFLNGFRIGLSVQNLFDVPPPHISVPPAFGLDPGFDGTNASPLGRVIAAQVTKRW